MSKIERWDQYAGQMLRDSSGLWVRYDDYRAEIEGLNADLRDRNEVRIELNSAQIEATHLRTELAEAHERCRALELAVEQADEMKAHAEASAAAEEAETDRVIAERDAAQAAIERLKSEIEDANNWLQADARAIGRTNAELEQAKAEVERLKDKIATTPTFINFPWDTYERLKNANEHLKEDVATLTAERDEARAEVEQLWRDLTAADGTIDGLRAELTEQDRKLETAQAEVKRLQTELEGKQCDQGILQTLLEGERAEVATLTAERDAAQAKIDRLTWELLAKVNEAHRVTSKQDCLQSLLPEERKVSRLIGERDEALAEVERLQGDVERLIGERVAAQAETKRLIDRLAWAEARVDEDAETGRIAAERDAAQTEAIRLQNVIDHLNFESAELTFERNEARAEVQRLTARLEHAQARIVPPLPHTDESAQFAQGKMDAYVTSLNAELHETRERLAHVQTQYDEFARVTAKTIDQHQRERDEARQQVYRLQQACGQTATNPKGREVGRFGLDGHYLDAMEPTRPTDEDIWREAFITMLPSYPWEKAAKQSDGVLVEYRKRWPR